MQSSHVGFLFLQVFPQLGVLLLQRGDALLLSSKSAL